jgi:hypothetical protein
MVGFGSSVHGMGAGGHNVSRGFSRGGMRHVPTGITRGGRGALFASIEGEELGRLNMARAPKSVRSRALAEAEAAIAAGEDVDGPLQNLALYESKVGNPSALGEEDLRTLGIYFGTAADMNIPVTPMTIDAVNKILGVGGFTQSQISAIATKAEEVRYDRYLTHQ